MVLTEKQAIQRTIEKLIAKNDLKREEIFRVLEEIKIGNATNAQIGGFLVGLVVKGVNVDELSAIAEWMRQNAIAVKPKVKGQIIDTCGTGGGVLTFNVSTANAIMAAAAGIPVAK
ncbi:MAG: anthranilate phosphoribosyltransferase, partial [Candidatus Bathyarchaeia archaeon]